MPYKRNPILEPTDETKLQFRIDSGYSTSGIVLTKTHVLKLCCGIVEFDDIKCANKLSHIILGIPMVFVNDCNLNIIKLDDIVQGDPNSENVNISNTADGAELLHKLFYANGYLYIRIEVGDSIVRTRGDDGECKSSLSLCFDEFKFDMSEKTACHAVKCKPVTWEYGYSKPSKDGGGGTALE
jgi:hypothetical protein